MSTELIAVIANIALTLSFIIALVFGMAQVRGANRDRRERLTLEALGNFESREFAELINYVTTAKIPDTFEGLRSLPTNEQVLLIQLAQQMESLGIMVAERIIDIDLVDKTIGSFVTTSWQRCEKMFLDAREKADDPLMAEYFQWLALKMDERLRTNARKPFGESIK